MKYLPLLLLLAPLTTSAVQLIIRVDGVKNEPLNVKAVSMATNGKRVVVDISTEKPPAKPPKRPLVKPPVASPVLSSSTDCLQYHDVINVRLIPQQYDRF